MAREGHEKNKFADPVGDIDTQKNIWWLYQCKYTECLIFKLVEGGLETLLEASFNIHCFQWTYLVEQQQAQLQ